MKGRGGCCVGPLGIAIYRTDMVLFTERERERERERKKDGERGGVLSILAPLEQP